MMKMVTVVIEKVIFLGVLVMIRKHKGVGDSLRDTHIPKLRMKRVKETTQGKKKKKSKKELNVKKNCCQMNIHVCVLQPCAHSASSSSSFFSPIPFTMSSYDLYVSMFRFRISDIGPRSRRKVGPSSAAHLQVPTANTFAARGSFVSKAISPKSPSFICFTSTGATSADGLLVARAVPFSMMNRSPVSPCLIIISPSLKVTGSKASAIVRSHLVRVRRISTLSRNPSSLRFFVVVSIIIALKFCRSTHHKSPSVTAMTVAARGALYISASSPNEPPWFSVSTFLGLPSIFTMSYSPESMTKLSPLITLFDNDIILNHFLFKHSINVLLLVLVQPFEDVLFNRLFDSLHCLLGLWNDFLFYRSSIFIFCICRFRRHASSPYTTGSLLDIRVGIKAGRVISRSWRSCRCSGRLWWRRCGLS
eukprot:28553_4